MGIAILMGSGGGVSSDDVTATRNQLLSGVTAITSDSDDEPVEGTIASQAGGTFNPTTSVRTLATGGKYLTSDVKVNGFALPPASALKKGYKYTLYGQSVTGTFQGYTDSPLYIVQNGVVKNLSTNSFSYSSLYNSSMLRYTGEGSTYARSNATFNLTDYKYIKFRSYKNTSYDMVFGVGTSSSTPSKTISVVGSQTGGTHIIDISSLSGSYYIFFKSSATGSQTITGVYDIFVSTT